MEIVALLLLIAAVLVAGYGAIPGTTSRWNLTNLALALIAAALICQGVDLSGHHAIVTH